MISYTISHAVVLKIQDDGKLTHIYPIGRGVRRLVSLAGVLQVIYLN